VKIENVVEQSHEAAVQPSASLFDQRHEVAWDIRVCLSVVIEMERVIATTLRGNLETQDPADDVKEPVGTRRMCASQRYSFMIVG